MQRKIRIKVKQIIFVGINTGKKQSLMDQNWQKWQNILLEIEECKYGFERESGKMRALPRKMIEL